MTSATNEIQRIDPIVGVERFQAREGKGVHQILRKGRMGQVDTRGLSWLEGDSDWHLQFYSESGRFEEVTGTKVYHD
jgi:hypothetical protein